MTSFKFYDNYSDIFTTFVECYILKTSKLDIKRN